MTKPRTIQEKAMIVRLFIAFWTARKYDKKVSEQAAKDFNAEENGASGRYNKILIAKQEIDKLVRVVSDARNWNYNNTLPWENDGQRVLLAANYMEHAKKMREFKQQFEEAVKNFTDNYPALVEDAKKRLGNMYNEADYPSVDVIASKFVWSIKYRGIENAADFRCEVSEADAKRIRTEIEQDVKGAVADAMKDLWERMQVLVNRMVERLSNKDAIFRDSLVENLVEMVEVLPKLNLTDDPRLEKIRKEIEQKLCSASAEELRKSDTVREKVADSAKSILDAMAGYMGGGK